MLLEIAAGLGLGGLVGVLVGLSASPVVGAVIGGLVALLGAFFGLGGEVAPGGDRRAALRIACFGGAALIATLLALGMRAHDRLGPSLGERQDRWAALGFTDREAAELVAYEVLGLDLRPGGAAAAPPVPASHGALFDEAFEACDQFAGRRFASPRDRFEAIANGPAAWRTLASSLSDVSAPARDVAIEASWRFLCERR